MPPAVPSSARRLDGRNRPRLAHALASGRVRWDRVGRVALLLVLGLILILYVGPARSFVATWRESKGKRAEVHRLAAENRRLQDRRRSLENPQTLETEARKLGMVRPGERAFIIEGLGRR